MNDETLHNLSQKNQYAELLQHSTDLEQKLSLANNETHYLRNQVNEATNIIGRLHTEINTLNTNLKQKDDTISQLNTNILPQQSPAEPTTISISGLLELSAPLQLFPDIDKIKTEYNPYNMQFKEDTFSLFAPTNHPTITTTLSTITNPNSQSSSSAESNMNFEHASNNVSVLHVDLLATFLSQYRSTTTEHYQLIKDYFQHLILPWNTQHPSWNNIKIPWSENYIDSLPVYQRHYSIELLQSSFQNVISPLVRQVLLSSMLKTMSLNCHSLTELISKFILSINSDTSTTNPTKHCAIFLAIDFAKQLDRDTSESINKFFNSLQQKDSTDMDIIPTLTTQPSTTKQTIINLFQQNLISTNSRNHHSSPPPSRILKPSRIRNTTSHPNSRSSSPSISTNSTDQAQWLQQNLSSRPCYLCGEDHVGNNCPFRQARSSLFCSNCQTQGHSQKACRRRKNAYSPAGRGFRK
jgi:hypothetical protein